jgi:hypothetical protein
MKIEKVRDLSLITLDEKRTMVIACDSCGGIGMKEGDVLKVPPLYVGKLIVRVPLLEVICAGAEVVAITDTVCNEMENTAIEIIKGIKEELSSAAIENIVLTGSTEENMTTTATGLGVTVVGIADTKALKVNKVKSEALIVSIGLPKVGNEINFVQDNDIVDYQSIRKLLSFDCVKEIVPVGSKGIAYEAKLLAASNKLELRLEKNPSVDINKSSGPSTCVIAAIDAEAFSILKEALSNVNVIGYLSK